MSHRRLLLQKDVAVGCGAAAPVPVVSPCAGRLCLPQRRLSIRLLIVASVWDFGVRRVLATFGFWDGPWRRDPKIPKRRELAALQVRRLAPSSPRREDRARIGRLSSPRSRP